MGLYCGKHKKKGMVNVNTKKCKDPWCKTLPNYNVEGETVGLYCNAHKKNGTVNVKSPTCLSVW